MKGKIAFALLGTMFLAVFAVGSLRAQKEAPKPRRADTSIWFAGEGSAWLGVRLSDVTREKASELKLAGEYGAIVEEVEEGSPAAKSGLAKQDVITEFAGERVRSAAQLRRLVTETPPGRSVTLGIVRAGKTQTMNVELEEHSGAYFTPRVRIPRVEIPKVQIPKFDYDFLFSERPHLGIPADELTPQLSTYFGVKQGKGVLVREVNPGSPADKGGLKAGDCIIRAGDREVGSISDLHRALERESEAKREVTLTIVRDRHEQTVKVELEKPAELLRPGRIAEEIRMDIDRQALDELTREAEKLQHEVD